LSIARSASSRASVSESNLAGEPLQGEHASGSFRSEPETASLHKLAVASPPKMMKPGTGDEATGISSRRAARGEGESDRPLVAEKRVTTVERRGLNADVLMEEREEPLGQKSHYGRTKDQAKEQAARATEEQPIQPQGTQMQVKWDDTNMKSSYANVCNVMSTREEVVLMFGVNQAWQAGTKEVTVQLTDRII